MTRKYEASIGSISHGTMRTEDLLDTFASELVNCRLRRDERATVRAALAWLNKSEDKRDEEEGSDIVASLRDILEDYAPPYCYFGTLYARPSCYFGTPEGDGADYGFWPRRNEIDELPRVDSPEDARRLMEDCVFVNDHGNVTVFNGRGQVILELV